MVAYVGKPEDITAQDGQMAWRYGHMNHEIDLFLLTCVYMLTELNFDREVSRL